MKTFEEVKEHLKDNYYNNRDIIRVFLAREGLNEKEIESIDFKNNPFGFKDFIKWYDSEEPSKKTEDAGDANKKYKISGENRKMLEKEYYTLTEMLKEYERMRDESKDFILKRACTNLVCLIKDGIEFAESELNETVD